MLLKLLPLLLAGLFSAAPAGAGSQFEKDVLDTSGGELAVTFFGHASLMLEYHGRVIQVDPWSRLADYTSLPKADLVLITHQHQDHLDPVALAQTRKATTKVIISASCRSQVPDGLVMNNGDSRTEGEIAIQAVPAYNLVHKRENGEFFHPRGIGNGYVLTFGQTRLYLAGDTENIPEMQALKEIDYAFLPMNLPYTMTPEMVADAVRAFHPRVLYPYHYGETDPQLLLAALREVPGVEVRIRKLR